MFRKMSFYHVLAVGLCLSLGFIISNAEQAPLTDETKSGQKQDINSRGKPGQSTTAGESRTIPKQDAQLKEGEMILREDTDVVTFTATVTDAYNRLVT